MAATRYAMALNKLDGEDIVVVYDIEGGRRLRIAQRGAAVVGYSLRVRDRLHEVAAGHRSGEEIRQRPGSRFAVMAPFAGRIAEARYAFDGVEHDLAPGETGARRQARHGFVRDAVFDIIHTEASNERAVVTFATQAIRPRPGYPFALDLAVRYVLDAAGLTLEAVLRNVGENPAPAYFGWHPYFSVGRGDCADWELEIPAATLIRTGADLEVLAGEAAYLPVEAAPALDFRARRRIGAAILDQGYADLHPDADGLARTRLWNPAEGFGLAIWQERGVLHAFTADTLAREPRMAVALEPMEAMANAFNRPECATAIRLEPGAERKFRCGVVLELA